ncbi:MAG TPA: hypothetical protein VNZ25_06010, partial [Candidatus Angelobacter sp.]|nr:hypothetical protein [Candidatus Angelobacter sp.]
MELKVLCDCGQKFKFDVEPANGRMPFPVSCPVCNVDATERANALIAEKLAQNPVPAAPEAASPPVASPPPIAPVSGGLRIARSAPEPQLAMAAPADNSSPPIGAVRPFAVQAAANPPRPTSFGKGLLGGLIGALVGSIIYLLIFKYTGVHLKLLAIGVGGLAGWFAEFLGKGEGSKELGGITAVFVIAGIIGAQYFVALGWWDKLKQEELLVAQNAYANAVAEAGEAVKMVPTGSDAEIRAYLARQSEAEGLKLQPADFQAEDVKEFRENQLPEYQSLASGRITKAEYDRTHELKTTETSADKDADDST